MVIDRIRGLRDQLRGNVGVMIISWFLFAISSSLTQPYLSLYMRYLGAGPQYIGAAFAAAYLTQLLTVIPGGVLTDTIGRRRSIVIGTWGITVTSFLYSIVPDWRTLFLVYVLDTGLHFYQPALTAVILDSLPQGRIASGMLLTTILPQLPWLVLPPVGGYLVYTYGVLGMRLSFVVSGVIALIVALLRMRTLSETLSNTMERPSLARLLRSYNILGTLGGLPREIRFAMLINMLYYVASSSVSTLLPLYAVYSLGVSTVEYGSLVSLAGASSLILGLAMTMYVDRIEGKLLILGLLITSTSNYMQILGSLTTLPLYMVSSQVGGQLVVTALEAAVGRSVGIEKRGTAVSMLIISQLMGQSVGSYLVGLLYEVNNLVIFEVPAALSTVVLGTVVICGDAMNRTPRSLASSPS